MSNIVRGELSLRRDLKRRTDAYLVTLALGESPDGTEVNQAAQAEAFEVLMKRHYGAVAKVAYTVLGSATELEDVLQSAFLAAFRSLESLQERSKFKYWVRAIAVNQARDFTHRHIRHEEIGSLEDIITLPEQPHDAVELSWQLEEMARHLPPSYMEVLYLRYYLGYSVNEAANLLGIAPGLVKWRTSKARRLASQILRGAYGAARTERSREQALPAETGSREVKERVSLPQGSVESSSYAGR